MTPGSKLGFFLTVDSIKGLSPHDFSAVHLQVRLSSVVGPALATEEFFPSVVLDMEKSSLSELKFRRAFSVMLTSKVLVHMREGYAPVEFFASVRPTYIERLERWDELREQRIRPAPSESSSLEGTSTTQSMRRSEKDFVIGQNHDVVAWLQISELGSEGQYVPVPVTAQGHLDSGAFCLHQGLQRRLVLSLSSDSGQQLPWLEVTKVRIGNVRLLDPKGRIHDSTSKALVTLSLLKEQSVEFKPDGSGALTVQALWDSSVHDTLLLNKVTAANQRILLQLNWAVVVETCSEPVQFSMDIAVTMQTRDARPPSKFFTFLGSTKILSKTSTLFNVRLTPPPTRSPKDLWRLDTSEKYVRGEESLGIWKPRGFSVVEDYLRLVSTERRAADVQAVRVILAAGPPRHAQAGAHIWASEDILRKALSLWQKKFGHSGEVCFVHDLFHR
jgi:kinesin family protein 1